MPNRIRQKIRKKMNGSNTYECDICKAKEILEVHHINGRNIPDYNHPSNTTNLCGNCHNKTHRGLIVIEGWFGTTNGPELLWHNSKDKSFSGQNSRPHII